MVGADASEVLTAELDPVTADVTCDKLCDLPMLLLLLLLLLTIADEFDTVDIPNLPVEIGCWAWVAEDVICDPPMLLLLMLTVIGSDELDPLAVRFDAAEELAILLAPCRADDS